MTQINPALYEQIQLHLNVKEAVFTPLGGGSINNAFRLTTADRTLFCKTNSATKFPHLFSKEADGLLLLGKHAVIETPKVIDLWENNTHQVLLLEWIEEDTPAPAFWKSFGQKLATLHAITQDHFGLETDNYMGAVPQQNTLTKDWPTFFIQNRLEPLVQQCHAKQLISSRHVTQFHNLYQLISSIFNQEPPALLHGDLWSGNFMCLKTQQPVLIDPAVYFGHRAIDLGMTTLFGGFERSFYEAYHYHHPLPLNYKEQWAISNLYPLLIHLLLFGKTYLSSIENTLNDFQ